MMNQLELPPDFPHEPPKGYHYEVESFRRNVCRICIVNDGSPILLCTPSPSGDSMMLKREGIVPINYSKQGDPEILKILAYTAMQLNPSIEAALYG